MCIHDYMPLTYFKEELPNVSFIHYKDYPGDGNLLWPKVHSSPKYYLVDKHNITGEECMFVNLNPVLLSNIYNLNAIVNTERLAIALNELVKTYNIPIIQYNDYINCIPKIICNKEDDTIIRSLFSNTEKYALICNGPSLAMHVPDFELEGIIQKLHSTGYKVILTSYVLQYDTPGIIFIDKLFSVPNIKAIGVIASYADVIIGKDSGLFYFCQNQDTIHKKFILVTGRISHMHDIVHSKFNTQFINFRIGHISENILKLLS